MSELKRCGGLCCLPLNHSGGCFAPVWVRSDEDADLEWENTRDCAPPSVQPETPQAVTDAEVERAIRAFYGFDADAVLPSSIEQDEVIRQNFRAALTDFISRRTRSGRVAPEVRLIREAIGCLGYYKDEAAREQLFQEAADLRGGQFRLERILATRFRAAGVSAGSAASRAPQSSVGASPDAEAR